MRESIKSIQYLRFIAATLVVFSHSMLGAALYFKDAISARSLYFANFGGVGVHIFFVISGFIMVYTSFEGKTKSFSSPKFLLRRFIRIYPIYWICAGMYLAFHEGLLQSYNLSVSEILKSLLLLPGYSPLIIGPGWTLTYEVYFYVCFGIFMILGPLKGLLAMSVFFLLSIVAGLAFPSNNAALHVITDFLLLEFLVGAWIAYFFVLGFFISARMSNVLLIFALTGFSASLAFGYHRLSSVLMWGVPSALLIAGFVFKERAGHLARFVKRISFLGDSSYSLYLLHILLIDLFFRAYLVFFPKLGLGYVGLCLALTVLCIIIAHAFYALVECKVVGYFQTMVRNISRSGTVTQVS